MEMPPLGWRPPLGDLNRCATQCHTRPSSFLLLVAMPFAPGSFLFLVVRPGAPGSVLAPSSNHLRVGALVDPDGFQKNTELETQGF